MLVYEVGFGFKRNSFHLAWGIGVMRSPDLNSRAGFHFIHLRKRIMLRWRCMVGPDV